MHIRQRKLSWGVFLTLGFVLSTALTYRVLSAETEIAVHKKVSKKNLVEQVADRTETDSLPPSNDGRHSEARPSRTLEDISPGKRTEPAGYGIIAQNNLFKPLGSGDEKHGPNFRLAGIIGKRGEHHALIVEGNKLYDVVVGQEISGGYRLVAVERGAIQLDGPDGEASLSLEGWGAASGSSRGKKPAPERKVSAPAGKKPNGPPSKPKIDLPPGVPKDAIRELLEKAGLSFEDVMSNPVLQKKLHEEFAPKIHDR